MGVGEFPQVVRAVDEPPQAVRSLGRKPREQSPLTVIPVGGAAAAAFVPAYGFQHVVHVERLAPERVADQREILEEREVAVGETVAVVPVHHGRPLVEGPTQSAAELPVGVVDEGILTDDRSNAPLQQQPFRKADHLGELLRRILAPALRALVAGAEKELVQTDGELLGLKDLDIFVDRGLGHSERLFVFRTGLAPPLLLRHALLHFVPVRVSGHPTAMAPHLKRRADVDVELAA